MTLESRHQQQELRAGRSLSRWGVLASVLIAMQVGIALVMLLPSMSELIYGPPNHDLGPDALGMLAAALAILVFYLGATFAFVVWMRRAALNLRLLHPNGGFEYSPGWCVGWWFVPFANLWKPFQAMHEIWHYSDPDAEHIDPETGYTRQVTWGKAAPPLLLAWWTSWIIMSVLDRVLAGIAGDTMPGLILAGGVATSAAVTCLLVIRQVTTMQRESFARRAGGPRVASAIGHVVGVRD